MATQFPIVIVLIIVFVLYILASSIRILREYERGVIFRLGRVLDGGIKGPGIILLIPFIDKMVKVSLRIVVMDVPPQDVITSDNVSIKVNAVVYFRVIDPQRAIIEIENFLVGTSQLSQTTLRSVLGQSELDELLSQRDKINRAKVIAAEGEFQASQRLADASAILSEQPSALTLRYLQTLREIATENNSTILFPIPLDIIKPFMKLSEDMEKGKGIHPLPTVIPSEK